MALKNKDLSIVDRFFAGKQYDRAIELLERLHEKSPNSLQVKMKLADAYFLYGRTPKAVEILEEVADKYARGGFTAKAKAVQRKIQRIDSSATVDTSRYSDDEDTSVATEAQEAAERELKVKDVAARAFRVLDDLFAGLSREEFDEIYPLFSKNSFAEGEVIVKEGVNDTTLFIITSGKVRVSTLHDGKEVELAELKAGEFFGEVGILTGNPRVATVSALGGCDLLELHGDDFSTLSERYPQLRHNLESSLERRAGETIEALLAAEDEESPR